MTFLVIPLVSLSAAAHACAGPGRLSHQVSHQLSPRLASLIHTRAGPCMVQFTQDAVMGKNAAVQHTKTEKKEGQGHTVQSVEFSGDEQGSYYYYATKYDNKLSTCKASETCVITEMKLRDGLGEGTRAASADEAKECKGGAYRFGKPGGPVEGGGRFCWSSKGKGVKLTAPKSFDDFKWTEGELHASTATPKKSGRNYFVLPGAGQWATHFGTTAAK